MGSHGGPLVGEGFVDASGNMQQHGTRGCAVDCADESVGLQLAVVVGDQSQASHIANGSTRRVSRGYEVYKGDRIAIGGGCDGGRVVQLQTPFRELVGEEVDEMLQDSAAAVGAGDARAEDGCEQGALIDVEIGGWVGEAVEGGITHGAVGHGQRQEGEEPQEHGEQFHGEPGSLWSSAAGERAGELLATACYCVASILCAKAASWSHLVLGAGPRGGGAPGQKRRT